MGTHPQHPVRCPRNIQGHSRIPVKDLGGCEPSTARAPRGGTEPYLKISKSHDVSLVFISAPSNFSVVSVGFHLQIASNPRTRLAELGAGLVFFFPGNAAICREQRNPPCLTGQSRPSWCELRRSWGREEGGGMRRDGWKQLGMRLGRSDSPGERLLPAGLEPSAKLGKERSIKSQRSGKGEQLPC